MAHRASPSQAATPHRPFSPSLISEALRAVFTLPLEAAELSLESFSRMAGDERMANSVSMYYMVDSRFQACAFEADGQHHVGVSAAVPALLLAVFFDIVNSTNPFSSEPSDEAEDEPQPGDFRVPLFLQPEGPEDTDLADTIESILRDAMPKEKWQRILAVTLAELATVFIFAHEIGHVVWGHTKLLSEQRGLALWEAGLDREGTPGRIARAWELQADRFAFGVLWSYAMNVKRQHERFLRRLKCKSATDPRLELLGRLCYVVSFVFFLLGQGREEVDAQGSHPSPLVRISFVIALAETIMEARHPESAERVHEVATRAHDFAEAAWNRLGLEFGANSYRDRIEDLPVAIERARRHLDRVEGRFGAHAWASALRRARTG